MLRRWWRPSLIVLSAATTALVAAPAAAAHTGRGLAGTWDGFLHPVLGLDHLVAMLAVGVLAYVLGGDLRVPAAFVAAMAVGGAAGLWGVSAPLGELAIAASVLALGAAVVAGRRLHRGAAVALVAVAGLAHGHAHGLEAPAAGHPAWYILGFLAATVALHATGWWTGRVVTRADAARTTTGLAVAGTGLGLLLALP